MAPDPEDFPAGPVPAEDVPPAPSPGGTTADSYVRRARGRASGGRSQGRVRPDPPDAPTTPVQEEDPNRPLTPAERNLREAILEVYTGAQLAAAMIDPEAMVLIQQNKAKCADAWIILARRDRRVKALLVKLTTGSAWSAVIMAHGAIVLPLLMKKGILPGGALFNGAGFQAMPGFGGDGGSQTDGWPYDVDAFSGTVGFQNGDRGGDNA